MVNKFSIFWVKNELGFHHKLNWIKVGSFIQRIKTNSSQYGRHNFKLKLNICSAYEQYSGFYIPFKRLEQCAIIIINNNYYNKQKVKKHILLLDAFGCGIITAAIIIINYNFSFMYYWI